MSASIADLSGPFDFVIVGGGASGLVAASRLTENKNIRVLVLEAGADKRQDPRVSCQGLALATYFNPDFDWCMATEPQAGLNQRPLGQPYGKTLGGSSAINLGMVVYPTKSDFDVWETLGNKGWGWSGLAPYLKKFQTYTSPPARTIEDLQLADYISPKNQGTSGPVQVSYGSGAGYTPFSSAWPRAWAAVNRKMKGDPITGEGVGGYNNPATIDPTTLQRSHAGTAYLTDEVEKRPNLRVVTEAFVTKILLDKAANKVTATGVEFTDKDGRAHTIKASHEVILAGGAIKTPQLLELSGIGSRSVLEKHDIPVVVDNANVGENLQDHGFVPFSWEVVDPMTSADGMRDPAVAKMALDAYTTAKAGPLTAHALASAYLPLQDEKFQTVPVDDLLAAHFDAAPVPETVAASRHHKVLRDAIAAPDASLAQFTLAPFQITPSMTDPSPQATFAFKEDGFYASIVAILNHPLSRGSTHIRSSDPTKNPILDPRAMTHPLDLELHARHALLLEHLRDTSPLKELFKEGGRRLHNGGKRVETLDEAKEAVRNLYTPHYHLCGTTAMLPKEAGGVVDSSLRVYGVDGLRIVDAGIFPVIPRGNIQADVFAVAEKASEILLEGWKIK